MFIRLRGYKPSVHICRDVLTVENVLFVCNPLKEWDSNDFLWFKEKLKTKPTCLR